MAFNKFRNKKNEGFDYNRFGPRKRRFFKKSQFEQKKQLEEEETHKELEKKRKIKKEREEKLEERLGWSAFRRGAPRLGWLANFRTCTINDDSGNAFSGIDLYFISEVRTHFVEEFAEYVMGRFKDVVKSAEVVGRLDLDSRNHLNLPEEKYVKLSFATVSQLMEVREVLLECVARNKRRHLTETLKSDIEEMYAWSSSEDEEDGMRSTRVNYMDYVKECLEYDVKYNARASIELGFRVGVWYQISHKNGDVVLTKQQGDKYDERAKPVVCAFDIETTKAPLLFPNADNDSIMMISYMLDSEGYLIVNREWVEEDIEDFEYTPKPEYKGMFTVYNVENEEMLLRKWIEHLVEEKPMIYVSYNGDHFDFPFIDARAKLYNISLKNEIGFYHERYGAKDEIYRSHYGMHLDCFYWVKRDSYLPVGSQGLKAVTKSKLGYNPLEVDYEKIVPMAKENPIKLAQYSVSDAVATYYLYIKYVQPFIFSLCTLIPMAPDDVLRKGTGTLCEALLMIKAFEGKIISPNPKRGGAIH